MKKRVLFIYNWVPGQQKTEELGECASEETIKRVEDALSAFDMDVMTLNLHSPGQLMDAVHTHRPDVAFVIAEGFLDEPETLYDGTGALRIRRILEQAGIPYTHSGPDSMEICRNKDLTYQVLGERGVKIPRFYVFNSPDDMSCIDVAECTVGYPMFVKPGGGGNSIGIDENSVVYNRPALLEKLSQLKTLTGEQPIIAETYLPGREYTAGVIGNGIPQVMPIVAFPRDFHIRSQQVKKTEYQSRDRFEILYPSEPAAMKMKEIAMQVFDALGARDVIRIDFKEDGAGNLYVIDVNGQPSLAVKGSLAFMAESVQISHQELVGYLIYTTLTRYGLQVPDVLAHVAVQVEAKFNGSFDNQVA
ncbi:MAG: ATP-grasp domain-containing protein [Bacillaceae bacterium]|nr:ATP-grasp domain-containing protein [Bacillaceae bacterium]